MSELPTGEAGDVFAVKEQRWVRLPTGVTSNGIPAPVYDRVTWLRRSRQGRKRHPLDPHGRCMVCGDQKLGYWQFAPYEPEEEKA